MTKQVLRLRPRVAFSVTSLFFTLIASFLPSLVFTSTSSAATLNYSINCSNTGPAVGDGTAIRFTVNQGDTIIFTNGGGTCNTAFANTSLFPAFEAISPASTSFPEANVQNFNGNDGNLTVKVKDNANITGGNGVNREYLFNIYGSSTNRGQRFYMTINAVPVITSITPSLGSATGGTQITITGSGFEQTSTVSVGGNSCTSVNTGTASTNVRTSTTITCTTPTGALGPVDVSVTISGTNNLTATSVGGFTYVIERSVSCSPRTGTADITMNVGDTLLITQTGCASAGYGGQSNGTWKYGANGTEKSDFQAGGTANNGRFALAAGDKVSFVATAGGNLNGTGVTFSTVSNNNDGANNPQIRITVRSITSITPSSGSTAGGTSITITGTGFAAGATVTVDGNACTSIVIVSATSITCTTPAGTAGAKDVVVTHSDTGPLTLTGGFTYQTLAAPAFTLSSSSESRTVNTVATGFTVTSTGGAIASFAINATPPGMSFNTTTGALSGTPNTVASATTYTITATNASGSATQSFTLTVTAALAAPAPSQTSSISSCAVATGSTTGGNKYAISGSFISPISNVQVGGLLLPLSSWVQTSTSVTITMPANVAGTVPIIIYNGQSPSLSSCSYTYVTPTGTSSQINTPKVKQPLATTLKLKIFFGMGSSNITSAERIKLKSLAGKIAGLGSNITITATGFAQPTLGSKKTDGALSKARAAAVASYLRKAGVDTTVFYAGAGRAKKNVASSRYVEIVAKNK